MLNFRGAFGVNDRQSFLTTLALSMTLAVLGTTCQTPCQTCFISALRNHQGLSQTLKPSAIVQSTKLFRCDNHQKSNSFESLTSQVERFIVLSLSTRAIIKRPSSSTRVIARDSNLTSTVYCHAIKQSRDKAADRAVSPRASASR